MYPISSGTRLNLENKFLENSNGTTINHVPVFYPRYAGKSHMSVANISTPRRATTMLPEAVYEQNENAMRTVCHNDNLFYPRMISRPTTAFPNTLYASGSHSLPVPLDISLANSTMKRPRLAHDLYSTKQCTPSSTVRRLPFALKSSSVCEKQVACSLGRSNGIILPKSTRVASVTTPENVRARLLASRTSLPSVNIPFESKDVKFMASVANQDHSKTIISVPSVTASSTSRESQLGNSAESQVPITKINRQDKPVLIIPAVASSASTVSLSETVDSATGITVTSATTIHIATTSSIATSGNGPKDFSQRDISTNRAADDTKAIQMTAFKHEPRKRKAQPLAISSVTSLGSIGMSSIKTDPWNASHLSQLPTRSFYYGPDALAPVTQIPKDLTPYAGPSSVFNIVGLSRDPSQLGISVPISRPQSILLNFPGSRRTCLNSIHNAPDSLRSGVVHRDRISRSLHTNKKRLILPNTMRRVPLEPLEAPRSWFNRESVYHETEEDFSNPFASLSVKSHMRSLRKTNSADISSSTCQPNAIMRANCAQSEFVPSMFAPVDNLLWNREFFGRSNPQQLVYTLIYMYARLFNLWSSARLRRLRCGFRSQFTFVLLKPGESTKQVELVSPESETQFTAIDSNLFRGDFKPLLMLQRLRLLYAPVFDNDCPESVNSEFGDSQPDRKSATDPKWYYLLDHFDANNHERCLLCYHAFYLSKRPSSAISDVDLDSYFLIWESNPIASGDWFRPYPIDARSLSLIVDTIRTALDCADLMGRQLLFTPATVKPFSDPFASVHESTQSSSPLNLVIRERRSPPNNWCETTNPHPTCLDYWPELTERARQSPWQCSDCKTCTVCQGKGYENELLICDACDKGFHSECHEPKLQEPVDRSMPWVCAACQKEGYSVAIGTLPGAQDNVTYPSLSVPVGPNSTGSKTGNSRDSVNSTLEATPTSDPNQLSYLIASAPTSSATCEPLVSDTSHQDESQTQLVSANDGTLSVKSSIKSLDSDSVPSVDVGLTSSHDTSSVVEADKSNPLTHSHSHVSPAVATQDFDSTQQVDATVQSGRIPTSIPLTSNSLNRSPDRAASFTSPRSRGPQSGPTEGHELETPVPEVSNSLTSSNLVHPKTDDCEPCTDDCAPCPLSADMGQFASRPEDIRAWSVEHVRDWLLEEGFPREGDAFFQQEIDGACLLLMKRMDVLTELGIKLGPAVKIYERIKRLQSRCSSPNILCS